MIEQFLATKQNCANMGVGVHGGQWRWCEPSVRERKEDGRNIWFEVKALHVHLLLLYKPTL